MYTPRRTLVSATAIVAMVQYCPAPFLAVIPEAVAVGLETASDVIDVVGGTYSTVLVFCHHYPICVDGVGDLDLS